MGTLRRLLCGSALLVFSVCGQGPPGVQVERITFRDGNQMPPAWNIDDPQGGRDGGWGGDNGGPPRIGSGVEWGGNGGGNNWGGRGPWSGGGSGGGDSNWGNGGGGNGGDGWSNGGSGGRGGDNGGRGGNDGGGRDGWGNGDGGSGDRGGNDGGGRGGGRENGNGGGRGGNNGGRGGNDGGGRGGGRGDGNGGGDGGNGGGRGGDGGGRGNGNGGRGGNNGGDGGGRGGNRPTTTTPRPTTRRPQPTTTKKATPLPKPGIDWFRPRLVYVDRLWSSKLDKHHFHTDQGLLGQWRANTFADEPAIGQVISVTAYSQYKKDLDWGCEDLVLLQAVEKRATWTEIMHTNAGVISDRIGTGFARLKNIGYCVSKPACGATKPLRQIRRKDGNNFVYTTSDNEFNILHHQDARYKGGGSGIICYLW